MFMAEKYAFRSPMWKDRTTSGVTGVAPSAGEDFAGAGAPSVPETDASHVAATTIAASRPFEILRMLLSRSIDWTARRS
jgi:hypothetical protein